MKAGKGKNLKKSAHVREENPELRKVEFVFFMVGKNHVTFGFRSGTSLDDSEGFLEGTGKNIRHVKLRTLADVEQSGLTNLMQAAARREGEAPMRGMRGK